MSAVFDLHNDGDSGLGECEFFASAPVDFSAIDINGSETQRLSLELGSLHLGKKCRAEETDDGVMLCDDEESACDGNSSFDLMPPPSLPVGGRINCDLGSQHCSRTVSMPSTTGKSIEGLRNRKRSTANGAPFGSFVVGKRWRVAEAIHEHEEIVCSNDPVGEDATVTFARPTVVWSSSMLEKGIYAQTNVSVPEFKEVSYSLCVLEKVDSRAYRRIDAATLAVLMRTKGDEFDKSFALIDCRYPYEYEGGHIKGAINVFDPAHIEERYFSASTSLLKREDKDEGRVHKIPIFYCEYSQVRGPGMAQAVRKFDRIRNALAYPHVDHPEMYVLEGGYKGFYSAQGCEDLCSPTHGYMPMNDNQEELKKFNLHKKGAGGTVSRLQRPVIKSCQPSHNSPISMTRRLSRRALSFNDASSTTPFI